MSSLDSDVDRPLGAAGIGSAAGLTTSKDLEPTALAQDFAAIARVNAVDGLSLFLCTLPEAGGGLNEGDCGE